MRTRVKLKCFAITAKKNTKSFLSSQRYVSRVRHHFANINVYHRYRYIPGVGSVNVVPWSAKRLLALHQSRLQIYFLHFNFFSASSRDSLLKTDRAVVKSVCWFWQHGPCTFVQTQTNTHTRTNATIPITIIQYSSKRTQTKR